MSTETRYLDTSAEPATVWALWSDPTTWGAWNPDVLTASLDGPMRTGALGTMLTKSGGTHQIEIAEVTPGRSFRLLTSPLPLSRFRFGCDVASNESSGSRISQSISIEGPLGFLFAPLMARRIADTFPALLKGLASAAENAAPAVKPPTADA